MDINKTQKINTCRICNSQDLQTVFLLPKMPFTDEFLKLEQLGKEYLEDIEIGICKDCGSVQNLKNTDMSDYYNEYTYSVQSSGFAMNFMSLLASKIKQKYFADKKKPTVMEIGSGSGEQLLEFKKNGFNILGIEPSEKLSNYANSIGIKTINCFFDENTKELIDTQFSKVDLIISSYTFDHIPRPVEVLNNIHHILNDNGILTIEVHDLDLIIERNEFCLFEHEHYTYLNKKTLTSLLAQTGFVLETFDLLTSKEKRANSLLAIARKVNSKVKIPSLNVINEIRDIENLSENIFEAIENFEQWLYRNKDKNIVAYGAGGRGVMTIAALKKSDIIRFIVDKNPKSENVFAPKSHLPVYNINILADKRADVIIVFSFGYFDEIVTELCTRFGYKREQFMSILDILHII
jgi:SAM-dependent methyltransferase